MGIWWWRSRRSDPARFLSNDGGPGDLRIGGAVDYVAAAMVTTGRFLIIFTPAGFVTVRIVLPEIVLISLLMR